MSSLEKDCSCAIFRITKGDMMTQQDKIKRAASYIVERGELLIFTGAGISVESGIPPFRGQGGLWTNVDPSFVEINHFFASPRDSWTKLKEIFYSTWGKAKPNAAHIALAELEKTNLARTIITQNIDCLHQRAGSKDVIEYHGTLDRIVCTECGDKFSPSNEILAPDIPACPNCHGLLKPDVVFYGEGIPQDAAERAYDCALNSRTVLVIGTTGEVMPACEIPRIAKRAGSAVIEVNIDESAFTQSGLPDIFLKGKAGTILPLLLKECLDICHS